MKLHEIHCCLDCSFVGKLVHIGGKSQCPQCASRAVWPVSGWSKSAVDVKFPFHRPKNPSITAGMPRCCEMMPCFLGGHLDGSDGHHS